MVKKWYSTKEVAEMLGYGPTKVRMMCITGDLRSLKYGGSRRILPAPIPSHGCSCIHSQISFYPL